MGDATRFRRLVTFISYSHADVDIARRIVDALDPRLFDVAMDDRSLPLGAAWEQRLSEFLELADVFVVLVSESALASRAVQTEIATYLHHMQASVGPRTVIPILLQPKLRVPQSLAQFQWLDLSDTDLRNTLPARAINDAIWGASYIPERVFADSERNVPREYLPIDQANASGERLQEMWDRGEIGLSPRALSQMVNSNVATSGARCAHLEADFTSDEIVSCGRELAAECVSCLKGRCSDAFHLFVGFCTVKPGEGPFERGVKLFYWCDHCRGPICVTCLDLQNDYPCAFEDFTSLRLPCPSCRTQVRVVVVPAVDYQGVTARFLDWCRAQGPPLR